MLTEEPVPLGLSLGVKTRKGLNIWDTDEIKNIEKLSVIVDFRVTPMKMPLIW